MSIQELIERRRGTAGPWRIEHDDSDPFVGNEYSFYHYGTRMLRWRESRRNGIELLDYSLGWGSVSDQNGMNTAFKVLGLPYRFDRDQRGGGPRLSEVTR